MAETAPPGWPFRGFTQRTYQCRRNATVCELARASNSLASREVPPRSRSILLDPLRVHKSIAMSRRLGLFVWSSPGDRSRQPKGAGFVAFRRRPFIQDIHGGTSILPPTAAYVPFSDGSGPGVGVRHSRTDGASAVAKTDSCPRDASRPRRRVSFTRAGLTNKIHTSRGSAGSERTQSYSCEPQQNSAN